MSSSKLIKKIYLPSQKPSKVQDLHVPLTERRPANNNKKLLPPKDLLGQGIKHFPNRTKTKEIPKYHTCSNYPNSNPNPPIYYPKFFNLHNL